MLRRIVSALLTATTLVACQAKQWVSTLVSDPPVPPPIAVVIACDNSSGSTCGQVELGSNLDASLQVASKRPGSSVSVCSFGADAATTRELGRVISPEASTRGDRAQAAQQRRWVDASRAELLRASRVIFDGPQLRASPIAEGISAFSLSRRQSNTIYVLVTDALQCTHETFDFECKKLPTTSVFLARLKSLSLLTPGSLKDTRVIFANARIAPVGENRCAMSISRVSAVRELWTAAIKNAGGTTTFTTDAVTAADLGGTNEESR